MNEVVILPDRDSLASMAAQRITAVAAAAIRERGCFFVALSGGSTPRPVYALLAEEPNNSQIDWARVHVFWGDERCVPPDHPDSNYGMANQVLLDRVTIPAENVHRVRGELSPDEAAAVYRAELAEVLGEDGATQSTRRFDLILLGMGADGHTASLFPGTMAVGERRRDVVAVYVERLATWRVTLTLPVINTARHVVFLVSGASKAAVLARVHGSTQSLAGEALPAGLVQPKDGQLTWLVDQEAAAALPQGWTPAR